MQSTKMQKMNSLRALQFQMIPLHKMPLSGAHVQARSLDSEEVQPVNHIFFQHYFSPKHQAIGRQS